VTGDEVRDEVPLTTFDQPPFGGVGAGWRHLVDYLGAVRGGILPPLRDRARVRPAVGLDALDVGRVLEAEGVLRLAQRPPYAMVVRQPRGRVPSGRGLALTSVTGAGACDSGRSS
jgi:hypothetical protein